jgi:ABC-2 type transport system permease protein
MKGVLNDIKEWFLETAKVFRREFGMVFRDAGVMLFFFALPLAYPIVYAAIYNPEVTREMPVAVVDNSRTAESREFVRHADATQAIKICGYASDLAQARRWWEEKKCFAVIEIPKDFSQKIGRGEQGVVQFYSDVSLLLRYRTFLESITELQMATDTQLRERALNTLGVAQAGEGSGIQTEAYFLGDPQQGFASFILPGIVVLILQQSLILGVTMLGGTSNDRRRRNGGTDPLAITASPSATIIGKTLCYVTLYLPLTIYILHYIPLMFAFPHIGEIQDYFLFMLPMLISSALLGLTLQFMVSERESAFIVVVFTSVAFLFLSGLTWPRYAMQPLWKMLGDIIPATWGIEGFIRINNNGAPLALESTPYQWLWWLSAAYFITAYLVTRYKTRHG